MNRLRLLQDWSSIRSSLISGIPILSRRSLIPARFFTRGDACVVTP
jgi:hypothetical protein